MSPVITEKFKSEKQAKEYRDRMEQNTGVKWDYYEMRTGWRFTPVISKTTGYDTNLADKLFPYLTEPLQTFNSLAEQSGMSLPEVLIASNTLVKQNRAGMGVNLRDNFAFIRRKYTWEK